MNIKYLPLGSIVKLKNGDKQIMIIGYATIDNVKKDKIYDYSGCLYPEGLLSSDKTILFDHTDLQVVDSLGFMDENAKQFLMRLEELLKNKEGLLDQFKNSVQ